VVALRIYQALTYLIWPFWVLWILLIYTFHPTKKHKYKGQLIQRLGLDWSFKPTPEGVNCWWFHAVSLGETQAVLALVEKVVQEHPNDRIIFSHMTTTAVELAKKHLGERVEHLILGPDLPFLARHRVKAARAHKLVFVESDVWPSLAYYAKRYGAKVYVVNGRLSDRSAASFERYGCLSRHLWNLVDLCLVQSSFQKQLWEKAAMPSSRIEIGGFLKLDREVPKPDSSVLQALKQKWSQVHHFDTTYYITLSCAHEPEEKLLVEQLLAFAQRKAVALRVMVAPRHLPRCESIIQTMKEMGIPLLKLSDEGVLHEGASPVSVLLIDRMGFLSNCYEISDLCLVAGSWVSHVGGHNILEPVLQERPTLCGPYVYKQQDVWQLAKQFDLVKMAPLDDFETHFSAFLQKQEALAAWKKRCREFKSQCAGSVLRCYQALCR
jgi:3-deoxy-D-manno-octulosonic-acid transferase